jgi:integrase
MESMLARLASLREWEVLESATRKPHGLGALFDAWRTEGETLEQHRRAIADVDLNAFVDDWQKWAERRATARTVEKYKAQLRVLMPEGERYPRSKFRRKELAKALQAIDTSGSTARRYHAAWSSFANYLVQIEQIEHNPLRDVRAPRPNPGRTVYLDLADQIKLVKAQPQPFAALAALREGAGVEVGAALGVRRRDVYETEGTVYIRGTKNEWRSRKVILEKWAWPIFRKTLQSKLPDALLFDGINYDAARREHKAALKSQQLREDYRIHDSRHSLAVRWMRKGIALHVIANNLGHRDTSMVERLYGRHRVREEDLRQVSEKISR